MINVFGAIATLWNLGFTEMMLIFGVIIMFFGAKRIPEIAKSLGTGIKEFKKSLTMPDEEETEKKIEEKHTETTHTHP